MNDYGREKTRYNENAELDVSLDDFKRGVRQATAFWTTLAEESIAELEAELAALRDRRCEGCNQWLRYDGTDKRQCGAQAGKVYTPPDFACNRWAGMGET